MIEFRVHVAGLKETIADLRKTNKDLIAPNLQLYRANMFKKFMIRQLKKNALDLDPISSATRFLTGDHEPMNLTGALANHMKIVPVKGSKGSMVDAGYFGTSKRIPGKKAYMTWNYLAELHHRQGGYRIPLTGEAGEKVRRWLAWKGLNKGSEVRETKKWIIVKPRPFFLNTVGQYIARDLDSKAVTVYFGMLKAQMNEFEKSGGGE